MILNKTSILLFSFFCSISMAVAQTPGSPYAGEQDRDIKALAAEEIEGYLSGGGMGFAKAAELNQYPGPKHVLQLASELTLSDEQLAATKQIYEEMHKQAVKLGVKYIAKERELDRLFSEAKIDSDRLATLSSEISELQGRIRFVHLNAHLKMKELLTHKQIMQYDALRGYGDHSEHSKHKHHDMNH